MFLKSNQNPTIIITMWKSFFRLWSTPCSIEYFKWKVTTASTSKWGWSLCR